MKSRPYITGFSDFQGTKEHNHHIAMVQFRESFNRDGYFLSPLMYPEGHGILEPVTYVLKPMENHSKVVAKIYWKRHPEALKFILNEKYRN